MQLGSIKSSCCCSFKTICIIMLSLYMFTVIGWQKPWMKMVCTLYHELLKWQRTKIKVKSLPVHWMIFLWETHQQWHQSKSAFHLLYFPTNKQKKKQTLLQYTPTDSKEDKLKNIHTTFNVSRNINVGHELLGSQARHHIRVEFRLQKRFYK